MNDLSHGELATRYALLCRSTQSDLVGSPQALQLVPHLSALRTLLKHDLRSLGRQGSPDDFADIYFELEHELERFHEFCSFPKLSQKFVVAFGGGFSAGKSSLINTLLGKRLLVTEVDPTTSLPTYLLQAEDDAVHAHNLFGHRISLSEDEFLSLTHDEVPRFGSNISRLLRSAFITRRDFPWQNLALIDTPGYTKHDDRQHSVRTDEQIARAQLNSAQAIVWVIDARQGCITEDDLKFIASLNPEIPRLIAVSRADQKPAEDIQNIVAGIRLALAARNVPVLDVVAVSARKKEWSPAPILEQLTRWNQSSRELRFAHNFKRQFTRYARFLENERRQAQQHLNRLNRILALTEEDAIQQDAEELKLKADGVLQINVQLTSELASLRHRLFAELKAIGDHVGIPLPEPSELDLLDEQRFDLLKLLRQQREAEGVAAPDEPATLRELMQPGDTAKIVAFLNGETGQAMGAHFAAKLDPHCRETYARFLAAIVCHERPGLTELQSALFLKLLESLGLDDIRTTLFAQVREMTADDFGEYKRIVVEHGLDNNLFFDALMLCRSGGMFNENCIQLLTELGSDLELEEKTVQGMASLSGYVLGLHSRSEYASESVLELVTWHPLFFRKIKKSDAKNGLITGYFKTDKEVDFRCPDFSADNLILISKKRVVFSAENSIRVNNSVVCSESVIINCSRAVEIGDSEIRMENEMGSVSFISGFVSINGRDVIIEKSSFVSNEKSSLCIGGKVVLNESTVNNFDIKIKNGTVDIGASKFAGCEKIEFDCSEVSNVSINNCEFSTKSKDPVFIFDSNTSIYAPPACQVRMNDVRVVFGGKIKSEAVAMLVKEWTIEKKYFFDKIDIDLTSTNFVRGGTTESSILDTMHKLDPKYKSFRIRDKNQNIYISIRIIQSEFNNITSPDFSLD